MGGSWKMCAVAEDWHPGGVNMGRMCVCVRVRAC